MREICTVILAALLAMPVAAQDTGGAVRRLSISLTAGGVFGGPASAIAGQLRAFGYGDAKPYSCFFSGILCSGPTDYPQFYGGAGGGLSLRYEVGDRWAVSGGWAKLDYGSATGYRAGGLGNFVTTAWSGSVVSVAAHVEPVERLSLGGGVSVNRFQGDDGPGTQQASVTRLGLLAEATLRLPRASRFFWEVGLGGHWLPGSPEVVIGAPSGSLRLRPAWSYLTLRTGIGIRLQVARPGRSAIQAHVRPRGAQAHGRT